MEKQLPFEHLVIVLLEGSPPGMSSSELLRREPFIHLNRIALFEKVDDHLTVADAHAIQLYPRVLALWPFARVRFINLLIAKTRQLEPCQEFQSERADRGQAPVWREVKTFRVAIRHLRGICSQLGSQNMKLTPGEMRTMRTPVWHCRRGNLLGLAVITHTADVLGFCRAPAEL